MSRRKERIILPDGREVHRLIPYPAQVRDGTHRCIACGQIDEIDWHDDALCRAVELRTVELDMGKYFIPVGDAAKDGKRQLIKRGSDFAAAQWTGDFWSYPYGKRGDEPDLAERVDFEPTHYWPQPPEYRLAPEARNRPKVVNELSARCTEIADKVVPQYRAVGGRSYSCGSKTAKKWQAAWDAACIALGGNPADHLS